MSIKKLYIIIGAVLVVAIAAILIFTNTGSDKPEAGALPSGHPDVSGKMGAGGEDGPSKSNVRQDFIQRLESLKNKVAAQGPKDTSDVWVLARMLMDSHQAGDAVPLLERYSNTAPKNTEVLLDLTLAYFNTAKIDKSLETTKRILKIDPKNTIAMYNLGATYAEMKNKPEAKKAWQTLIDKYPASDDAKRATEGMKQLNN